VFSAGRCLLLGKASAGPVTLAVEGEGWGYYAPSGALVRCDDAGELAATVLAAHRPGEIIAAIEWAWRDLTEAAEAEAKERAVAARLDAAQAAEGRRLNRLADLGGGNR
jgi:hypothetical protein